MKHLRGINIVNENLNMTQEQIIYRLKSLIDDWEQETEYARGYGSDPGFQYEQETKVEQYWEEIADFCKENFK